MNMGTTVMCVENSNFDHQYLIPGQLMTNVYPKTHINCAQTNYAIVDTVLVGYLIKSILNDMGKYQIDQMPIVSLSDNIGSSTIIGIYGFTYFVYKAI